MHVITGTHTQATTPTPHAVRVTTGGPTFSCSLARSLSNGQAGSSPSTTGTTTSATKRRNSARNAKYSGEARQALMWPCGHRSPANELSRARKTRFHCCVVVPAFQASVVVPARSDLSPSLAWYEAVAPFLWHGHASQLECRLPYTFTCQTCNHFSGGCKKSTVHTSTAGHFGTPIFGSVCTVDRSNEKPLPMRASVEPTPSAGAGRSTASSAQPARTKF